MDAREYFSRSNGVVVKSHECIYKEELDTDLLAVNYDLMANIVLEIRLCVGIGVIDLGDDGIIEQRSSPEINFAIGFSKETGE